MTEADGRPGNAFTDHEALLRAAYQDLWDATAKPVPRRQEAADDDPEALEEAEFTADAASLDTDFREGS